MTATTARVRAAVRDLERHGDITPAGARVIANICDHEELMHIDNTDYDDIPTTAIPYNEPRPDRRSLTMGMFDSLYDSDRNEWQTKAFTRSLARYPIGSAIAGVPSVPAAFGFEAEVFQVKVLGGPDDDPYQESFATVRDGVLEAVPAERDATLALLDYGGGWLAGPTSTNTKEA